MSANAFQPTKKTGAPPADDSPMLCMAPRGLAIYPVRYAVVPDTSVFANVDLPGHMGKKVIDVALEHHKYALRLLREGFIYVYYHAHPNGKKWDIFQVNEDAQLAELNVKAFKKGEILISCAGLDHFFIDEPDSQGNVDFAFSEHPWSKETLATMESDGATRDRRMQTLKPQVWIGNPDHSHGMTLTDKNLEKVFEFSDEYEAYDQFDQSQVMAKPISDEQGKHDPKTLKLCTSMTPFRMHHDALKDTVKEINIAPNSQRNQPMIFALWDAVGITRELNGFALDAAGWADSYFTQHELELDAINHLDSIQQSLEEVGKAQNKRLETADKNYLTGKTGADHQEHITQQNQRQENLLKNKLKTQYADVPAAELKNIPKARAIVDELIRLQKIKDTKQKPLEEQLAKRQQERIASNWSKYKLKIDSEKVNTFKQAIGAIEQEAGKLINKRIADQIAWLESSQLMDALVEFHEAQLTDGRFFNNLVSELLFGLGSCQLGHNKLKQYVAECAVNELNIFWRAVAANQKKEKAQLNTLLAEARAKSNEPLNDTKILGLEKDLYDRLLDIVKVNNDSHSIAVDVAGKKVPSGGLEKIYATVGVRLFTPLITLGIDTPKMLIVNAIYNASLGFRLKAKASQRLVAEDRINFTHDNQVKAQAQQIWDKDERVMDIDEKITAKKHQINQPTGNSWNKDRKNWGQDGYDKWYREYGHTLDAERTKLQGEVVSHKHAVERFGEFRKGQLERVKYSYEHSVKVLNRGIDKKIALYERWGGSDKGITFGFGIITIAFQAVALKQVVSVLGDNPEDKELALKLTIASTGILGTGAALAQTLINNEKSLLLKGLEIGGGSLLIVNGFLSGGLDFYDAYKKGMRGNWELSAAYFLKSLANFVGGGLSTLMLAATINKSWEAAISMSLRPIALRLGNIGIDAAGRFVLARFIGIASLWVGLGIFALEIIIVLLHEDELEQWIEQTKFAKDPANKPFKNVEQQQAAFEQAIIDVFGKSDEQIAQEKRQRALEQHKRRTRRSRNRRASLATHGTTP